MNLNWKKISYFIITSIIVIIIFCMYVYYYYGGINKNSLISHFVMTVNIILSNIIQLIENLISLTNEKVIIGLIIIIGSVIYVIKKGLFNSINIESGNFKVSLNREMLRDVIEETQNRAEELREQNDQQSETSRFTQEITAELEKVEIKNMIVQALLDNELLVELLANHIRGVKKLKVPLALVPIKIKTDDIGKLFTYELNSSNIIITGLKDNVKSVVIDVYQELINKGVINSN